MSSSPPRRLLDPRNLPKLTIRRRPRLRCRLFSCAFLCVFWIYYCVSQRTRNSSRRSERTPDHTPFTKDEVSNKSSRPTIFEDVYDPGALAAILPVTSSSFPRLSEKLSGLSDIPHLSEVYLICPENITSVVRHRLRQTLHQIRNFGRTEFFVTLWRHDWTEAASILEVASNILSGVILILPQDALVGIDSTSRGILFSGSPLLPVPLGLRGSGIRCDARYQGFLAARFVLPPLVLPSRLGVKNQSYFHLTSWQELGAHFTRAGGVGGVVPPGTLESTGTCDDMDTLEMVTSDFANFNPPSNSSNALLVILAAERGDVAGLLALACEFKSRGTEVEVVAYGIPSDSDHRPDPASEGCEVAITEVRRLRDPVVAQFPGHTLGVILTLVEYHFLPESFLGANGTETVIRIPRSDLPHCDWIASLRLQELRSECSLKRPAALVILTGVDWHIPRVEISVITNDRPSSLNRLLQSLSSSRYFGDKVNIRINIEQDADYDTLELIDRWSWEHGSIFLNRRVIHAGLLPAVVESWYPHTNNSYGLILEDDVEVSPLFYGWLKMNLLRYRCVPYPSSDFPNQTLSRQIRWESESVYACVRNQPVPTEGHRDETRRKGVLQPQNRVRGQRHNRLHHPVPLPNTLQLGSDLLPRTLARIPLLPQPSPLRGFVRYRRGRGSRREVEPVVKVLEEVFHRVGLFARVRDGLPELRQLRVALYESPRDRVACEGYLAGVLRTKERNVPCPIDRFRRYDRAYGSPT